MATRNNRSAARDDEGSPGALPTTSPSFGGGVDHSFTLQTIIELQRSVSTLSAKIDAMAEQQKDAHDRIEKAGERASDRSETAHAKAGERVGKLEDKLSGVTHKIYAATAVLTVLVMIGGWMLNSTWSLVSAIATPAIQRALNTPTSPAGPSGPPNALQPAPSPKP